MEETPATEIPASEIRFGDLIVYPDIDGKPMARLVKEVSRWPFSVLTRLKTEKGDLWLQHDEMVPVAKRGKPFLFRELLKPNESG